jgi:UDP-N-acetylglucosamine 2-epimerase (non-hydrolysing)
LRKPSVLFVFGTRPEAIKMAPVYLSMGAPGSPLIPRVCVTGQHRAILDVMLARFGIEVEHDLEVMRHDQTLNGLAARVLEGLDAWLGSNPADFVLVQGDTTTTMAAAMAAFYRRIPVGHVEAGLRTGDLAQPFPEEINRVLTTRLAALHFAPTARARSQLIAEGVDPARIEVTGNTAIDALLHTKAKLVSGEWSGYDGPLASGGRRLVVVTAHRRESFGEGFERICDGIRRVADSGRAEIVYPVHPNPNVRKVVHDRLSGHRFIHLIEPLDYVPFVDLMRRADVLLTDSGGVQEEGPSLGLPVLVMREKTERQEAVEAGTARLVGTDPAVIEAAVTEALFPAELPNRVTTIENPFGDGRAAPRIVDAIHRFFMGSTAS